MKNLLMIGLALVLAFPAAGQELSKKEQRQLNKQMKKEQQAAEAEKKAAVVNLMVEHRKFVLEADRLRNSRGQQVNVSSMINFVAVDSTHAVIQIGSNSYVGLNGVGGITVEGPLSNYKADFNEKNGVWNVSYNVRTTTGTYDVRLTIYGEARADATVSSNWPGRITYSGYLFPPGVSKVYKGTSYY